MTPLDARLSHSLTGGPSFSLGNRFKRLIWGITWACLARWTPPPLHAWRRFLLNAFGARIASTARVYGTAVVWLPSNLTVGEYAAIGPRVICYCMAPIRIDDYAIVSQGSHLCAGTHDTEDPLFQLIARPITIEKHAWVAAEAFVGPGVTIGEGAVLGARAVAFRDIGAWEIHVGNPATKSRDRSKEKILSGRST
jgi:putative colanic acid biosynthesis acetyltransferase WcaF